MKQIKENKLISAIVTIPLLLFIIIFVFNLSDRPSQGAKVLTEVEEWGKFPGLNIKIKTEESSNYSMSISTPTTSSESINKVLQNWLDGEEKIFRQDLKELSGVQSKDLMSHFNIQMEIIEVKEKVYNLVFRTYAYLGAANGENKVKVFTLDLAKDQIYELDDIISLEKEKNFTSFKKLVQEEVKQDEDLTEFVNTEDLVEALKDYSNLEWSISREQFRLYFNQYAIAPGSEGIVTIDIPLEKLSRLIDGEIVEDFQLIVIEDQIKAEQQKKEEKEKQEAAKKQAEKEKQEAAKKQAEKEKQEAEKKQEEKEKQDKVETADKNKENIKAVALTFDDGPSGTVTPEVLNILDEFDAVATFFMLGSQVDYYPDLAAEVVKRGHEVANHTQNHVNLTTIGMKLVEEEISLSREKIEAATGQTVRYVRPPYGAYDENMMNLIDRHDESIILWSVDPRDWESRQSKTIAQRVIQDVHPGAIVLLHDIHQTTADALPQILKTLKEDGYTFVTVSELIELENLEAMQVIRGK